jgi:dTDP-4-amino-4,6-dideoxygalactose transaminase
VPDDCEQAYHVYYLLLDDGETRDRFICESRAQGITCPFHYLPLHLSPVGLGLGGREGQCPVTENVASRLVRLPLYAGLTREEQERIVRLALEFV